MQRAMFVDNCSSYVLNNFIEAARRNIRTTVRKFPVNATDFLRPADTFIILQIIAVWFRQWDELKNMLIIISNGRMFSINLERIIYQILEISCL